MQQTRDGNAVLVSSLDSAIRLMDKANGQLLQSYLGHRNREYRIRSCLGLSDAVVISGSEDGRVFAWDLLEGSVMEQLEAHDGKVASAVACNGARKEWASAGVDGELSFFFFFSFQIHDLIFRDLKPADPPPPPFFQARLPFGGCHNG